MALILANLLSLALHAQVSCVPDLPRLRYPAEAMESKVSGTVLVNFNVDARGAPEDLQAVGHPLLTLDVKGAFRSIRLSRRCSGMAVSTSIIFRIDDSLPPSSPVTARRITGGVYELVSPAENVVVISDPPVTYDRPGAVAVVIHQVGDDELTVRLSAALAGAFRNSKHFTLGDSSKPDTLIITVPRRVGWREFGERTQVRYTV
ncbi:MAG: energy transducer TonB [Bryobacterales bacterium]|nr:energy transducer TonB [Bryobacterales bacterium]